MDTRQLRAFCEVVDRKSFSQAAERLGVTQPAVSLQVRSLEKRLGLQLLDRSGRRVAPTEAGLLLYRGALSVTPDLPDVMEKLFTANGWPPQWRNGVYGYQHYHSSAHEVLGFASGSACLILGGPGGIAVPMGGPAPASAEPVAHKEKTFGSTAEKPATAGDDCQEDAALVGKLNHGVTLPT